eukprot:3684-Hanusia_phi.AAC.4
MWQATLITGVNGTIMESQWRRNLEWLMIPEYGENHQEGTGVSERGFPHVSRRSSAASTTHGCIFRFAGSRYTTVLDCFYKLYLWRTVRTRV